MTVIVAMGLGLLAGLPQAGSAATTNRVLVSGPATFVFSPNVLNIAVGDTVLWTNVSSTAHDVTQGTQTGGAAPNPYWSPLNLSLLGRATVTFSNVGAYPYICNQHVRVNPQPGPQTGLVNVTVFNFPPTVDLTSPSTETTLLAPAALSLSATASDQDGTVTNLQLLVGNNIVAEAPTSPLAATVTGLPGGNYALRARAVDNLGRASTSAPVNLVVSYRVDYFSDAFSPAVLQIKPGESVLFTNLGGLHTVSGSGTQPFCGSAATPIPFCKVTLSSAGSFPYRCVFHSFGQASGMTGTVAVVASFNRAPLVGLTSPASSVTLPAGQNLTLQADALDPDGSVNQVTFRNGNTVLSADNTAPFSFVMNNLTPGVYMLNAVAADNAGLQSTSAPVAVTVVAQTDIRLTPVALEPGGFRFTYTADPGQRYVIEGSTTANAPSPFVPLGTNTASAGVETFVDPAAATRSGRAYRVFRQP